MSDYLLDTNVLIDLLSRGKRSAPVERLLVAKTTLAATSVTVTEVFRGMRLEESATTERLMRSLVFYPVDFEAAKLAGELFLAWRRKGVTLGLPDSTIAAVCLRYGLTLVTSNVKHFPMPELTVIDARAE